MDRDRFGRRSPARSPAAAARARLGALAAAAVLLAVGGCHRSARPEVLVLATARQPAFALVFVAEANGFFADEGLRVEQRRFATGRDALDALVRGDADAATAFDTPVVLRAGQVRGLEVLTTLHVSSGYNRIIARRDHGIASEADLRGKRIAGPRHTSADYLLDHVLRLGGVAEGDVTRVDLGPDAAVDALVAGRVDAVATWPPLAERAEAGLGPGVAVELRSDAFSEASMLVTRAGVRQARPEVLVRFVRALARAERLVWARPDAALEALAPEFPELGPDAVARQLRRLTLQLGLSGLLSQLLAREAEWFRTQGELAGALDVRRLLVPDVLSRVSDEAVTLVLDDASPGSR